LSREQRFRPQEWLPTVPAEKSRYGCI